MESRNRPLSPHLQIYTLPLTGLISITHRLTGTVLALGLVFFVYSFGAIAASDIEAYTQLQLLVNDTWVSLFLILFVYALFFHFCHGIRHFFWDAGLSFEKETMNKYALIELVASVVLTALSLFCL